jgi:hypothetical protein
MYDEWFMVAYENNMVPNQWLKEAEQANQAKHLRHGGSELALVDSRLAQIRAGLRQLAASAGRTKAAARSWITRPPTPKEQCC